MGCTAIIIILATFQFLAVNISDYRGVHVSVAINKVGFSAGDKTASPVVDKSATLCQVLPVIARQADPHTFLPNVKLKSHSFCETKSLR